MSYNRNILQISAFAAVFLFLPGCKKFLDVDLPQNRMTSDLVFTSDGTALSAISGLYADLGNDYFSSGGSRSVTILAGISSDELQVYFSGLSFYEQFSRNAVNPSEALALPHLWSTAYSTNYRANSILQGIDKSKTVTSAIKRQLEGESRFIRAFCFFYLVNLFGDVPLITTTDYNVNKNAPRTEQVAIYDQMISDLLKAKELLSIDYSSAERIRPNRAAASALLSRVYLYRGEWGKAETESSLVIDDGNYDLVELNKVFLANSKEAIWQLMAPQYKNSTNDGQMFILQSAPDNEDQPVALSNTLINSFELNDERFRTWVDSTSTATGVYYFPWKYKNRHIGTKGDPEYSMVLRLAEQYLIRAEARAQQNKLSLAIQDLDAVRQRAGLDSISTINPSISQQQLLLVIEHERQIELFSEWGHRWLDLKRTGRADTVLGGIKADWQATDVLYPIPEEELKNNPQMKPQNPGY